MMSDNILEELMTLVHRYKKLQKFLYGWSGSIRGQTSTVRLDNVAYDEAEFTFDEVKMRGSIIAWMVNHHNGDIYGSRVFALNDEGCCSELKRLVVRKESEALNHIKLKYFDEALRKLLELELDKIV